MTKAKPNIKEEEINDLINNETWLTGEDAAKYFNIELEESINVVACSSNYFNKYRNMPSQVSKIDDNSNLTLPVMDEATKLLIERIKNKIR